MSAGKQIQVIRKTHNLTQEQFGNIFHVTRQTVSNWENEKSYPDLQTLITLSDMYGISLDTILKDDNKMVKTIDTERLYGCFVKKQKSIIDFLTGAGTGLLLSCLYADDSERKIITLCTGLVMLLAGWYKNPDMTNQSSNIWKIKEQIKTASYSNQLADI